MILLRAKDISDGRQTILSLTCLLAVVSNQKPNQIDQIKVVLDISKHELSYLYFQLSFEMTRIIRNVAPNDP
jgi:hypothetical protein